ncbi:MAG: T9SS type A sorting domain-containing protein [Bacteroidetes bacterium]|nr:T9SS type A sorting domain-containing protein [Bacteroidota bacterium]MBU1115389.1 T9SS type A sorting domain-containing protein [Bacteroidota bacterium]MBU1797910.1 T9SS type A sorting domain-containing protein [Bacteroidota bacterium]
MKSAYLVLIILVFGMGSISAQSFVGKLNQNPSKDYKKFVAGDKLKILAVMSDFQTDIDDATFGDGKFGSIYSEDYGKTILDPLPHDKAYFENHFKFVQNYFAKVSNGILSVEYTVLEDVLTVSKTMRNYTPPLDNLNDQAPLAEYIKEVWTLADQHYSNVNFSDYDLFIILHAGVGKDISLPGSLGNERDLPSVYLNINSFQKVFGSDYEGISVNGGSFNIRNSAIMPETESREISGYDATQLIELTTNGLLAATIGSYLGLPDLYNTETGRSAIGRFGLMDGQSMFSFQGIFPPEPSAWEKMFLGWVTPTEISVGNHNLNIVNKFVANPTDTTLIKIPINSTEYYLIENRKRDALQDGSKITYVSNGQTLTKTLDRDSENYIYYSVDTLEGVIVDVDEFDWALPGEDRKWKIENFKDVGLIIWHIDEAIIDANYESNTINNDRYKRGVAIVEADGIRDIGEDFQTIFGELVIGEGTKEDTWYSSNPADYYENKFSYNTKPKAESNSGVNSLITLSNFSDISNRTSFNLTFGSEYIDLIGNAGLPINDTRFQWISSVSNGNNSYLLVSSAEMTYLLNADGSISDTVSVGNMRKPTVVENNGLINLFSVSFGKFQLTQFTETGKDTISITDNEALFSTSPIIYSVSGDVFEILLGTMTGKINKYYVNVGSSKSIQLVDSKDIFPSKYISKIAVLGNDYAAISINKFWSSELSDGAINISYLPESLVLTRNINGDLKSIVKLADNNFATIVGNEVSYHKLNALYVTAIEELGNFDFPKVDDFIPSQVYPNIILADLKNDGSNYIIQNNGAYLEAFNLTGAEASNFPIQDEYKTNFISSPLAVDLNNDNAADIITFTEDGDILAVDGITGKVIDGFPISSGKIATVPIVFTENGRTALGVVTENNNFMSWNISQHDGKKFWTEENGNASNTSSVVAASSSEKIAEFFPQSKAYNWPNPVYNGFTNIRYYVSEDSKAVVTIFDLAGDLVAKLSSNGIGGHENEIVWNVKDIQSGVYFAHLEVTSNSGKTDTKIIKIAVIK